MKLEGQLKNEIKSLKDSISTQERTIKGFQNQIEVIQKQIFYWEELERLQKIFKTETDPDKKAKIQKEQLEIIGKIRDRNKKVPALKLEIDTIQAELNKEKLKLDSLKQEKKGKEGEKNALPYSVSRGNVKKAAVLAGALALSTLIYNYFGKDKAPKYTEKDNTEDSRETSVPEHKKADKSKTAHHNEGLTNKESQTKKTESKIENSLVDNNKEEKRPDIYFDKPEEKKEKIKTEEKFNFVYIDRKTGRVLLETNDEKLYQEYLKTKEKVRFEGTY